METSCVTSITGIKGENQNVTRTGTLLLVYLPFCAVQQIHELLLCLLQHLLSHFHCNSQTVMFTVSQINSPFSKVPVLKVQ